MWASLACDCLSAWSPVCMPQAGEARLEAVQQQQGTPAAAAGSAGGSGSMPGLDAARLSAQLAAVSHEASRLQVG